ncbi:ArsR family transcriptional regulator [Siculibacillus lacustris]|uniref:ArsR family transcriptional regulator n=1 Tax=Siculibacillus lacustris TaxID=1549641 RepID=A0A4Q9VDM3_9HYPH|nr:metalloregulator ArsR/SmtB family transcription factor [Siculibacillus lacustris]TBW32129.1 ArsR family transcriptional regulator [Siculibacillus lacustris]
MSSSPSFSAEFCSSRLKAIADPTRWAIAVELMAGAKTVGELKAVLRVEPTLLSHHLKIMKTEGFAVAERVGKYLRYRLAPAVVLPPPGHGIDLGCCRLEMSGRDFVLRSKE